MLCTQNRGCKENLTTNPIIQAALHLEKLWALNVGVTTRIVDCCTAPMLIQQVRWPGKPCQFHAELVQRSRVTGATVGPEMLYGLASLTRNGISATASLRSYPPLEYAKVTGDLWLSRLVGCRKERLPGGSFAIYSGLSLHESTHGMLLISYACS